jgi:hypothetical protein
MLDLARDRRTLVFMTILPIAFVPVLLWVISEFVESGVKTLREDTSTIALINGHRHRR